MELEFRLNRKTGKTTIVAKNAGGTPFTTEAKLLDDNERESAIDRVHAKFPGVQRDQLAEQFEEAVAEGALSTGSAKKEKSQADRIVELALERYRLGMSESGEPFACQLSGPPIALPFRGSKAALRCTLAREYYRVWRKTANASALNDALTVLEGEARDSRPEPVHLRLAAHGDGIVLDLGRKDGRVAIVGPRGWLLGPSPVLFQRTALTGELVEPEHGGDISELFSLINLAPESRELLRAWLVAALIPGIAHPILMLGGEQGTGKSTAAKFLAEIIDASPAPLRSQPRDGDQWACSAAAAWCIVCDNVSTIPPWWSDALCKSVTGDGWVKRTLFTDADQTVLAFRRVVVLTSIDAGSLRGDLGDRVLVIDFERIPDNERRPETEIEKDFQVRRGRILGALLDLLVKVFRRLPALKLKRHPRLADFARVLAALDDATGTTALHTYLNQGGRIARDVLDADPVGCALVDFMESRESWEGTAADLLKALAPRAVPVGWPRQPNALSGVLTRLAPALRQEGIEFVRERTDTGRRRLLTIRNRSQSIVTIVPSSGVPSQVPADVDDVDDQDDGPRQPSEDGGGRASPGLLPNTWEDPADAALQAAADERGGLFT